VRSQLQQKPQRAGGTVAMRRKDGEGGSSTATCGGEAGCALSGIAQRANAGPHAKSLAGLRSVVAQRAAVSGGPVAQRILRIGDKNYKKEAIRAAVPKWATSRQVDRLVEMGDDKEHHKYESWEMAINALPQELGVPDEDKEDDPEWQTNKGRLANLDKVVRQWAKRAGGRDSSGHGDGKTISKGHDGDRHQNGQKRKAHYKGVKADSLESALRRFAQAGGTEKDLQDKTRKWLNKSGVSWSGILENATEEEEL
jgi:hypothetical protein